MSDQTIHVHAVVKGIVQGVGFRYFTQAKAQQLGVSGTVANRYDGSVECELEGPAHAVNAMVEWLHDGPSSATVTGLHTNERDVVGLSGFEITG
ncbi:acylphosphatase [Acidipropionibacterium virtanenii]|uniref:acylphosphatase n=1 Tax=Acidipropionibacterium virtanenii TaxID=2057246 RepID=A0A344UY71_9ACTN|nr:acylphosphatase [Acidipropionibacterium virtanenii]AXE40219.1 Acylphosphatase [Acidipropionibacterium virtanenii]